MGIGTAILVALVTRLAGKVLEKNSIPIWKMGVIAGGTGFVATSATALCLTHSPKASASHRPGCAANGAIVGTHPVLQRQNGTTLAVIPHRNTRVEIQRGNGQGIEPFEDASGRPIEVVALVQGRDDNPLLIYRYKNMKPSQTGRGFPRLVVYNIETNRVQASFEEDFNPDTDVVTSHGIIQVEGCVAKARAVPECLHFLRFLAPSSR